MKYYENRFIITIDPENMEYAENEARFGDENIKIEKWIDNEAALCTSSVSFNEYSAILRESRAVFIRHLAPVNYVLNIENYAEEISLLASQFDWEKSFSVQTRIMGGSEIKPFEINGKISEIFKADGAVLDVKTPEQVISVLVDDGKVYCGVSYTYENMSSWAGGKHRYMKNDTIISRAEFKLLEAFEIFEIDLKKYKTGLDLGAAPGGWSKVLADSGIEVAAVDPAELDDRVKAIGGIRYYCETAQRFIKRELSFDIIVNDMKMDTVESSEIMNKMARLIKKGGLAVMTLKLPSFKKRERVDEALEILSKKYTIIGARQLFHNRHEVTIVMEPKKI